jgi:hypothetical protein
LRDLYRIKMPVKREDPVSVFDDHKIAISGELSGEPNRAFVDAPNRLTFGRTNLDTILDDRRTESTGRLSTESRDHLTARRPGERALKRPDGQRRMPPAVGVEPVHGSLQYLLRRFQLARQLRVEVAPSVDRGDQRRSRSHGAIEGRACPRRLFPERPQLRRTGLERRALAGQRLEMR